MSLLSADAIERLARDALQRAGAAEHQAAPVARAVRRAEEDGIGPVGLGYLPTYLAHLKEGRVDGRATPLVVTAEGAVVRVDARGGFAHPAFDAGFAALCTAARRCGVAALAVEHSYSVGVLGHPCEDIAAAGLVALGFTNSPPNMAAAGGRRKVFGTNPIAFAVPRGDGPALVVDQATSVVTKVALAQAAASGGPIPAGWALDAGGCPTTDPQQALSGSLLPAGGVKGANIALLVETMALLAGGRPSLEVAPYALPGGAPPDVAQMFVAFDPAAFPAGFGDRFARLATAIAGDGGARLPGDRRIAARARAQAGIAVDDGLLRRIEELLA